MEWVSGAAAGAWIAEALEGQAWGLRSFVPDGFEAYARVFHPFTRDRAAGHDWAHIEADFARGDYYETDVTEQEVSWAQTAAAFGTTMHPLAQSHRLVGREYGEQALRVDTNGWRYHDPDEGRLTVELLGRLATVLARRTDTAASIDVGIWEGWGGLVSASGDLRFYAATGAAGLALRLAGPFLGMRARWKAAHAEPGSGLLSREAASGPRLALPGRDYVVFRADIHDFETDAWMARAPWVDEAQLLVTTPSLMWPEDRSWFLAGEIDFDSTIIGGSAALIADLLAADGIEAARITLDDDLTVEGDTLNA